MTVHVLGAVGALHTATTAGATRVCGRDGCDTEFVPVRSAHAYCSRPCRTAAWKARRGYQDQRKARRPVEASRNASTEVRRSRPVRVRPTLTFEEAQAILHGLRGKHRRTALVKIDAALLRARGAADG